MKQRKRGYKKLSVQKNTNWFQKKSQLSVSTFIGENMRTYARFDHPCRAEASDRRGCSLIEVIRPNNRDGHARNLSSELGGHYYSKRGRYLNPYLLRVTMIRPERNMPDELAPSIKQFERLTKKRK